MDDFKITLEYDNNDNKLVIKNEETNTSIVTTGVIIIDDILDCIEEALYNIWEIQE